MTRPRDVLLKVKKNIAGIEQEYLKSSEFEAVASNAAVDFVNRVKRGFMPDLSKIAGFTSEAYIKARKKFRSNLGDRATPTKSNATATGQMLADIVYRMTPSGFRIFINGTSRRPGMDGRPSKLTNAEVARYYSEKRDIFDFSEQEIQKIIRKVRTDLLKIVRRLK